MTNFQIQTQSGLCPTHGAVDTTREIPKLHYPLMYSWPKQVIAKWRRPFTCPICGPKVTVGAGAKSASRA